MDLHEKKQRIDEITAEQKRLLKEVTRINKLPMPKRIQTLSMRILKVLDMTITVRRLEAQKHIIAAIPNPKPSFEKGGLTVVGGNTGAFKLNNR